MKALYRINLTLMIITIILLSVSIFLGLLFTIVTGCCQLVMFFIYLKKWKVISDKLKIHFKIYGVLALITLFIFFISSTLTFHGDLIKNSSHIVSVLLALYFLYVSKRQYDFHNSNIETNELLNS